MPKFSEEAVFIPLTANVANGDEKIVGVTAGGSPTNISMTLDEIKAYSAGSSILTSKVNVSSVEILALRTTPILLVDPPGANKTIVPICVTLVFRSGTVVYTGNTNWRLSLGGTYYLATDTPLALTANSNKCWMITQVDARSINNASNIDGGLFLGLDPGPGTDPAAGNGTIVAVVTYTIIDVS